MSLRSMINRVLARTQDDSDAEPAPRHERREAGRDRHPCWGWLEDELGGHLDDADGVAATI